MKTLVVELKVFIRGTGPQTDRAIAELKAANAFGSDEDAVAYRSRITEHMHDVADDPRGQRPFFSTVLRDGRFRVVYPDPSDPLRFEEQIYRSADDVPKRVDSDGAEKDLFPTNDDIDIEDLIRDSAD